jgi:hypothetical protein
MEIRYGRKRKGIRLELRKKIEEWVNTIDDAEVRAAVSKDVIVTGGAIASMLLGEKVNDFDVYFRTIETTKMVADYYVDKFVEANPARLGQVSPDAKQMLAKKATITNIKGVDEEVVQIFIKSAGVAGESDEVYEYFEDPAQVDKLDDFVESLVKDSVDDTKGTYRPIFISQNAITLSNKIQIVVRFHGEPDQIHANYDFAHAMNYYDYRYDHLELRQEALECLLSRTLVYRGSLYPIASIFRAKKFIERGWRVSAGELLKIMWQITEVDLKNPQVLQEQLTGVDAAYMWQLIQALKNVEENKINSSYVAEIIDRIFS